VTGGTTSSDKSKAIEETLKPFVDDAFDALMAVARQNPPIPIEIFARLLDQTHVDIEALLQARLRARFAEPSPFKLQLESRKTGDVAVFAVRKIRYTVATISLKPEYKDVFDHLGNEDHPEPKAKLENPAEDAWTR
jgi:hypothetical protein